MCQLKESPRARRGNIQHLTEPHATRNPFIWPVRRYIEAGSVRAKEVLEERSAYRRNGRALFQPPRRIGTVAVRKSNGEMG